MAKLIGIIILIISIHQVSAQTDGQRDMSPAELIGNEVQFNTTRSWSVADVDNGERYTIPEGTAMQFRGTVTIRDTEKGYYFISPQIAGRRFWVLANDPMLSEIFSRCAELNAAQKTAREIETEARRAATGGGSNPPIQTLIGRHSPNGNLWGDSCYNFIQRDGRIGQWGLEFLDAAESVEYNGHTGLAYMMDDILWQRICPGFSNFDLNKKKHFLAYFIATKAMDESTCNPSAYADRSTPGLERMPNPPGLGFFMLEGSASLRAGRDRGLGSGNYCQGNYRSGTVQGRGDLSMRLQYRCAVSQIIAVQYEPGRPFGYSGGYWQQANSLRGDISQSVLNGYAGCAQ
jgi:hypothetical protein